MVPNPTRPQFHRASSFPVKPSIRQESLSLDALQPYSGNDDPASANSNRKIPSEEKDDWALFRQADVVAVDRRHRRDGAHRKDSGDLTSHGTRRADEAPVALPLRYAAPRTHAWALRIASRESFALDALCPVPSLWRVCDGGHAMEILAGCYVAAGCNPLSGFRSCLAAHAEITEAHLSSRPF
jgi:hypothetical protein